MLENEENLDIYMPNLQHKTKSNEILFKPFDLDNLDLTMQKLMLNLKNHRTQCSLIDYQVTQEAQTQHVYTYSEAYNASLSDLYRTNKNENMEFSEEQLIELAFQVLKNIQYNNSLGLNYKCMLRMENINFNQMGRVKVQEMIHVFLDKYSISQSDLIYLSPEMLKSQYSTNKADIWTLGIILLLCMSLDYDLDDQSLSRTQILQIIEANKSPKLLQKQTSQNQEQEVFNSLLLKESSQFHKLIRGEFLDKSKYSKLFMNFLSECLTINYAQRSDADELLCHPVFRQQNQIYLSQQIEFSQPFTLIEKQYLKQLRQQADSEYIRDIGNKKLYEITILKALESNQHDSFLKFIQEQLDKKKQYSIQLSKNGGNNRRLPILSRLSMNDEQIHSKSKSKLFDSNKQTDSFEFLVLKPDLQQAQVYLLNYNASSIEDWSTVEDKQSNNQQTIKDTKQNMIQQNHQDQSSFSGLVSDSMSVQSSFMDKISSIFSFGIAARQTPSNNQTQQQMQQNQNMKSNSTDKNSQQSISPDKFSRLSQNDKNSKFNSEQKQNNAIHNKPDMIKRYLKLCHSIENHSISITKISQIVRKNQDILSQCKYLRKKVWIRLLPDTNIFYQNILDFETELDLKLGNVSIKESSQVWNDIKRCEHFHPLLRNDLIKKQIRRLILVFLDLNEDTCCYVQGLDSIAVVLYTEYAKIGQEHLIITMMKQIFTNYLRHFIDKETNNLSFKYPCILVKRLLAFYEPELYVHFNEIDFQHDMYLVCWVMTLFAHTISIDKVVNIWTDLFCERVEYLFFINIAILQQIKDKLLLLDLNSTLIMINNIQGLIDVDQVLIKARDLMRQTPESFIQSDFIFDLKKQNALNNMDLLRENEYFAQRWWELEYLDYRDDIELPLIQVDNAINIIYLCSINNIAVEIFKLIPFFDLNYSKFQKKFCCNFQTSITLIGKRINYLLILEMIFNLTMIYTQKAATIWMAAAQKEMKTLRYLQNSYKCFMILKETLCSCLLVIESSMGINIQDVPYTFYYNLQQLTQSNY